MKKLLPLLLVFVLAASLFVACSPNQPVPETAPEPEETQEVTPDPDPEPDDEEEAPEEAGLGGEITIAVEEGYIHLFSGFAATFEAESGITITVVEADMFAVLDALPVQQGETADIFILPNDRIGDLAQQRLLADLGFAPAGFVDAGVNAVTFEGTVYALPLSIETTLLMFNADVTTDMPETLAELDPQQFAAIWTNFYFAAGMFYSNGGYIFGDSVEDIGLANAGSIAAGEAIQELFQSGVAHWTLMQEDDIAYDVLMQSLIDGDVEFVINGPWAINDFENGGVNVGLIPIPSWDGSAPFQPLSGVKGLAVNAHSSNLDSAIAFVEFLNTGEFAQAWFDYTSEVSPHTGVTYEPGSVAAVIAEAAANATPMPTTPEFSRVWEPMADALIQIAAGQDVEAALEAAVERILLAISEM